MKKDDLGAGKSILTRKLLEMIKSMVWTPDYRGYSQRLAGSMISKRCRIENKEYNNKWDDSLIIVEVRPRLTTTKTKTQLVRITMYI